jgi:arsenite methyltransferase
VIASTAGAAGWFEDLLGAPLPMEGGRVTVHGHSLVMTRGLLRDTMVIDASQQQIRETFGFKWAREDTYSSPGVLQATQKWLVERYGDLSRADAWRRWRSMPGGTPLVLDAGCGAGLTANLLIGDMLRHIRYVGVDISDAVDVAARRFARARRPGSFLQADICALPLPEACFDFILSEGVLHHTPSTRGAILAVAKHLKLGGAMAFYLYAKKAPVREFTDDLIRDRLSRLPPREAWDALMPLTMLGRALGELNVTVEVPEAVELLSIPAGRVDVQRLFYWYFCKMYHRPEYTLEEMNHVNFDWFTPSYSHRQTPEQVRAWCLDAGLEVEEMKVESAGINTLAVRKR